MNDTIERINFTNADFTARTPPHRDGKRMHLYIAGPMHGRELYNFPAFDSARDWLLDDGYKVTSPADLDRRAGYDPKYNGMELPDGFMEQTMRRDIVALLNVDGVALLPGWEKSKGTAIELTVARALGLPVWVIVERVTTYFGEAVEHRTWSHLEPLNQEQQERRQYDATNPMPPTFKTGGIVPGLKSRLTSHRIESDWRVTDQFLPFPKATEDDANPKDRYGDAKPPLHLVPSALTIYVSKVMQLGAKKYGAFNWRTKKVKRSVYVAAILRHLLALFDGQDVDPESGMPHEAHIGACVAILLDAKATGNLIDDRPVGGAAADLLAELSEVPA